MYVAFVGLAAEPDLQNKLLELTTRLHMPKDLIRPNRSTSANVFRVLCRWYGAYQPMAPCEQILCETLTKMNLYSLAEKYFKRYSVESDSMEID